MDFLDELFREFWRNRKTFLNYKDIDAKTYIYIYDKAEIFKEGEYFLKRKQIGLLRFLCKDAFLKKRFDYQALFWILCIDPNLDMLRLYIDKTLTPANKINYIEKTFCIDKKYLNKLIKLELEYRKNFDFALLENVELQQKENYVLPKK